MKIDPLYPVELLSAPNMQKLNLGEENGHADFFAPFSLGVTGQVKLGTRYHGRF